MINLPSLDGSKNPLNLYHIYRYRKAFYREHPTYFRPDGLLMFCGAQGTGKTLSAVNYVIDLEYTYPRAIICTNVLIKEFPINCYYEKEIINDSDFIVKYYTIKSKSLVREVISKEVDGETIVNIVDYDLKGFSGYIVIEYDGLHCLTDICNGFEGVVYLIDEIHLEFNSLESKNVPIEVMIEVSQQRKQRKHIVGTSQQFLRLAKPLREQVRNLVLCRNFIGCIQFNKLVDGNSIFEKDGHVQMEIKKRCIWFHTPFLYDSYDTYRKMKRYSKEWQGVSRDNIY